MENNNYCESFENTENNNCRCDDYSEIKYVPNEFFYNSCDCSTCDCEQHNKDGEMLCSCGYMNPLRYDYSEYSCKCEYPYMQ